MRTTADSFGAALLDWVHGSTTPEIIERDDGVIEIGAGPEEYLARCAEWPLAEQRAMRHVRGRVVDMGCGGGRVALHLQDRGFDVAGADVSELAQRLRLSVYFYDVTLLKGQKEGTDANKLEKSKTDSLRDEINEFKQKLEMHKKMHNCDLKINI